MKYSFKEFLLEAPLPDDWDSEIYNDRIPFARRVKYAKQRASSVGTGSSRIAFKIPYQGRNTILKIAKNKKGMAQNEFEAQMMTDYYLKGLGVVIPIIDYDEQNASPTWIHTEFAEKAKPMHFKQACGLTLPDLMEYCELMAGKKRPADAEQRQWMDSLYEKLEDNDLADGLVQLIGNYDIPVADFYGYRNWGVYQGNPVIIDIGLSTEVFRQHYS